MYGSLSLSLSFFALFLFPIRMERPVLGIWQQRHSCLLLVCIACTRQHTNTIACWRVFKDVYSVSEEPRCNLYRIGKTSLTLNFVAIGCTFRFFVCCERTSISCWFFVATQRSLGKKDFDDLGRFWPRVENKFTVCWKWTQVLKSIGKYERKFDDQVDCGIDKFPLKSTFNFAICESNNFSEEDTVKNICNFLGRCI